MKKLIAILGLAASLAAPGTALAQEKLTLLLDWFINPDHGPIIIAREKGFFAEQGLEVEIVEPADPSAPPKLIAAGQADLAVSYQPQTHVQVAEGLPLMRIATIVATPLNTLVVLKDGDIQAIRIPYAIFQPPSTTRANPCSNRVLVAAAPDTEVHD